MRALTLPLAVAVLSSSAAVAGERVRHHPPPHIAPAPPQSAVRPGPVLVQPAAVRRERREPLVIGGFRDTFVVVVERPVVVAPPERRVRLRSGELIDPSAVATRLPSGRIAFAAPYAPVHAPARVAARARPYAPPAIHILGEPPTRHMRGPVRLSHGVEAPRRMATAPRVIWLDSEGRELPKTRSGAVKRGE